MKIINYTLAIVILFLCMLSCSSSSKNEPTHINAFELKIITIDGTSQLGDYVDISTNPTISLLFSEKVDELSISENIIVRKKNAGKLTITKTYNRDKSVKITIDKELEPLMDYELVILPNLKSMEGIKINTGKVFQIRTEKSNSNKFPEISDEELLTLVQKQTFNYFWDFGHPISGMARERTTSGNTVTTGGTGFGVMAMVVASERKFISRKEALDRVQTIVDFLSIKAQKYHGAYAHWINGETGVTIPFSTKDNGADLVETALLFQGLLTARSYFDTSNMDETHLRDVITKLWEAIEWDWFSKDGEKQLYWHWSPNYGWDMNLPISGWNESLIVYLLAASSPTHSISKTVYDYGWAKNGKMKNGKEFYDYTLPLGPDLGGPLFFSQYSFLGINPKDLSDTYANDYFKQNEAHTLINRAYCIANPKNYKGYGESCWGLSASDGDKGYNAFSPTNDLGVITPTAALSSMPYTPKESMDALKYFYYKLGDKLWSRYGFYDAFNLSTNWFDDQHIAINQGPIIIMIENQRTGLLWNKFMAIEEIRYGFQKLGFTSPNI